VLALSRDGAEPPVIRTYDFNRPVIDFYINHSIFWVLVDDGHGNETVRSDDPVRCVKWSNESQEFIAINTEEAPPLLHVLNSESRLPASPDQRKRLDLYADLSWLPKNIDLSRDPMRDDILAETESGATEELSIRQQGRLRHKKALIAKLQKGEPGPVESVALPDEEPEPKKIRQDRSADGDKMNEE